MIKKIALAAVLAAGSVASANAAVIYASEVVSSESKGYVAPDRMDPSAALGAVDGKFYSLGLGGSVVLGFSELVSGVGSVSEVTYNREGYFEYAKVRTSLDGISWSDVINVANQDKDGVSTINAGTAAFKYIEFVDVSVTGKNRDGFDIDSVGFEQYVPAPVPLPAAGLLLLGGLAGMGGLALRRKKA